MLSFACGEEPQSVVGHCEDIPLYRNVYDHDAGAWTRVGPDGGALSAEENERIDAELNRTGGRCLTPIGPTTKGGSPSSDASSGGSPTDASSGGSPTDASSGGSPTDATTTD
jgi:hypothetical protein